MNVRNCWEFKGCGRELGGAKVTELGVCPASSDTSSDTMNGGRNSGRMCWAIVGTFCGGEVQGSIAQKQLSWMACDFFSLVKMEEGAARFMPLRPEQVYRVRAQA